MFEDQSFGFAEPLNCGGREKGRGEEERDSAYCIRPSRLLRGGIDVYEIGRKMCEKKTAEERGTCAHSESTLAVESSWPFYLLVS